MQDGNKLWAVIDVETGCVRDAAGEWSSAPWVHDEHGVSPWPLLIGIQPVGVEGDKVDTCFAGSAFVPGDASLGPAINHKATLIGHNIKFDAGHVPAINDHTIWDTMIAEYILTAQVSKFASLESLRAKYMRASTPKRDLIGSNLAKGIPPQDIPMGELMPYLYHDLSITAGVFKCQWELATPEQRALIMVQSTASLAYGEIEKNGLHLDVPYTIEARDFHAKQMQECREVFANLYASQCPDPDAQGGLLRLESMFTPKILSTVFFRSPPFVSGQVDLTPEEKIGLSKSRKYKQIQIDAPSHIPALDPSAYGAAPYKGNPDIYTLTDDILAKIETGGPSFHAMMAGVVRKYRENQKIHGTYLDAWLTEIEKYGDRRLHPKVHSTSTDTGRTSSAGPNVQNIPDEGRACVSSRFPEGYLLEADFKQLEVMGLAEVSGCTALINALRAGTDIHYESGKSVFGWTSPADMDKEARRVVKTINFGLIYGGSAPTLAAQAGIEVEIAKALIRSFYTRFPGVKLWQDHMIKRVTERPDSIETREGQHGTVTYHTVKTATGRSYSFPLEPPPAWMPPHIAKARGNSASPTKVKNYPVQGFATGDIVPLAVMLYWKELRKRCLYHTCKLVNVVHDSMLVDCENALWAGQAESALRFVVDTQLPAAIKSLWDIELSVPLAVDVSIIKTWKSRSTT